MKSYCFGPTQKDELTWVGKTRLLDFLQVVYIWLTSFHKNIVISTYSQTEAIVCLTIPCCCIADTYAYLLKDHLMFTWFGLLTGSGWLACTHHEHVDNVPLLIMPFTFWLQMGDTPLVCAIESVAENARGFKGCYWSPRGGTVALMLEMGALHKPIQATLVSDFFKVPWGSSQRKHLALLTEELHVYIFVQL